MGFSDLFRIREFREELEQKSGEIAKLKQEKQSLIESCKKNKGGQ